MNMTTIPSQYLCTQTCSTIVQAKVEGWPSAPEKLFHVRFFLVMITVVSRRNQVSAMTVNCQLFKIISTAMEGGGLHLIYICIRTVCSVEFSNDFLIGANYHSNGPAMESIRLAGIQRLAITQNVSFF